MKSRTTGTDVLWPMIAIRRRLLPAFLVLATMAGVTLTTTHGSAASANQAVEPWPAFTMVWRDTGVGLGLNGASGTQLFRLEYTDRRHFRTTLLEHSAMPGVVGSTWEFNGSASIFRDARIGREHRTPYGPDELTVPDQWLVPGGIDYLLTRPAYTRTTIGDGLAVLRNEQTFPDGKVRAEEITFRLVDKIPTRRVTSIDGVEVSRKEVVEFRLGKP